MFFCIFHNDTPLNSLVDSTANLNAKTTKG
jgi:hypothetical protein